MKKITFFLTIVLIIAVFCFFGKTDMLKNGFNKLVDVTQDQVDYAKEKYDLDAGKIVDTAKEKATSKLKEIVNK